ncbi:MAG: Spermidine N(1)-acetyltransferase [Firmicutes bacterium ADurb.Bin182]|nr:MAG: Spermidine N(1)-acetyltransferase [Firmicutes bacterium ADurb.Bin182]
MNIKGRFVTLRAVEEDDLEMLRDMMNDSDMEQYVVGWSFPVSKEQQHNWYINLLTDSKSKRFIIETKDDGAVGIVTLTDIDWKNRSANHGIKLANRKNRTKGIGTDAVMALMRYTFDELGLHRLDGAWFDDNVASKGLYTKCGWSVEGVRREYVFKGGQFKDLAIVGVLASDYYALIEKNHYWD